MVFNHVPCNARIIGTHEHQSHFVYDIVHNNTKDIQPQRHSTDTHGTIQVNFSRMRRAISYVNSGKFRVKTEAEQQIWNECSRLIANAIIHYNTLLLSRVYEQKLAADDQDAIKIHRGTSSVAWRDVNLIDGRCPRLSHLTIVIDRTSRSG
jgi:TnpA family transposase